jgi:multiple sugar transport system substrate-binding protein
MKPIILNGITWNHSRGLSPLQAIAQRYSELHPNVTINWSKRSLQEFADFPIEKLTKTFDVLVIDHPWVGCAAATQCVLPLNEFLSEAFLADQASNSVGQSHQSYNYNNQQWALAIDAATPIASYRKDLLPNPPKNWNELLELANTGKVAIPAIPIDVLMNFYTFCIALGKEPFLTKDAIVDQETGIAAINTMKQLYQKLDTKLFSCNPIAVAELMSSTDDYWYCPFAYGYSNYARNGYANHLLTYTDVVDFNNKKLKTTIGGTGLAVSAFSTHQDIALDFAAMVASGDCQRTLYVQNGGQPGHRSAWVDVEANRLTNGYFENVLPAIEHGYMRPRYNGYLHFQDHAGIPLQQCLQHDGDPVLALREMNGWLVVSS